MTYQEYKGEEYIGRDEIAIKLVIEVTDYIGNLERGKMSDTIAQEIIYDVIGGKLLSLLPPKLNELIEKATVECPDCKGNKKMFCIKCMRKGEFLGEDCPLCNGTGYSEYDCEGCQGSGSIIQPEGLVRLADNQELPFSEYPRNVFGDSYLRAQQDMLKDNWRKVINERE